MECLVGGSLAAFYANNRGAGDEVAQALSMTLPITPDRALIAANDDRPMGGGDRVVGFPAAGDARGPDGQRSPPNERSLPRSSLGLVGGDGHDGMPITPSPATLRPVLIEPVAATYPPAAGPRDVPASLPEELDIMAVELERLLDRDPHRDLLAWYEVALFEPSWLGHDAVEDELRALHGALLRAIDERRAWQPTGPVVVR